MEKMYIKSRLDCPPPESRQLLKDKDNLIQKQQEQLKDLEASNNRLKYERDVLHGTLNQLIQNICSSKHQTTKLQKSQGVKIPLVTESSDLGSTPPSSSSSSSNSTSSLQLPQGADVLMKGDAQELSGDLSSDLNESMKAIYLVSSAQNELIKSNQVQFLNDDYLMFINSQLNSRLTSSIDSCRSLMSANSKLDPFQSQSNLAINPTSLSSLSLSTTPISSASSSLSSLKQKEDTYEKRNSREEADTFKLQELEEEKGQLNRLIEVRSLKNSVNSISSSMILSPNVKRTINKKTGTTSSNYRFKECPNSSEGTPTSVHTHKDASIDYELSNDLKNKEIEILYRKYGGHLRCKRAARVIQLAFREYRLRKNYLKLCESNMKRRSFDMNERISIDNHVYPMSMGRQKLHVDLPSVDFENLVGGFNDTTSFDDKTQNKKESITSEDYKDYKNFDEFNHVVHTDYKSQPDETDYEYDLNSTKTEHQSLLRSSNKSASTSSIHLVGSAQTTPVISFNRTKDDFESIRKPIVSSLNPPVSNRSIVKNKNIESMNSRDSVGNKLNKSLSTNSYASSKSCHLSAHSVNSSASSSSCQSNNSPKTIQNTDKLVNKNIYRNHLAHQVNKPLTKSPCSVNSLFSATSSSTKQSLLLTKETPKKQKSKMHKMMHLQPNFFTKDQEATKTKETLLMGPGAGALKPEFDLSKRKYLVGLNLFNRKPEKGVNYLIDEKFLERNAKSIAEFLFNRNCLSKQMIGEYISNTQDKFILQILTEFIQLIDLRSLPVDEALRKFQTHFRMPGESQKIEHLLSAFSLHYIQCNLSECQTFFSCADETINVLAYAIILLNTSIHNPNVKASERMKFEQFLKMTKGIDNGQDIEHDYMHGIYERVKSNEFKPGKDHTNSVNDFEKNLVGPKKPTTLFSLPHRRLVCLVQLYEIFDLTKKEKSNSHQRECFLFNDILVVTKIFSKKKSNTLYTYRCGFPLQGMNVVLFVTNHYQYGIRLIRMPEKKVLITFNARNENDQQLFCRDLAESIAEANEMEHLRIKMEMDKFKSTSGGKLNNAQIERGLSEMTGVGSCKSSQRSKSSVKSGENGKGGKTVGLYGSPSAMLMAPPATPTPKMLSDTGVSRLHKRTLSNSLLDLNSSGGSKNGLSNVSNSVSRNVPNSNQCTLQRTGSECSLMITNTAKLSLTRLLSLSSPEPKTPNNISKIIMPINDESTCLNSSTDNLELIKNNATKNTPVIKLTSHDSFLNILNYKSKLVEEEKLMKKNSFSAQTTSQNNQRQREVNMELGNIEPKNIHWISLEEKLRKNKIFASDDYEYINYFGTPNIKTVKSTENELLLNGENSTESDIDSLSPSSLSSQSSRPNSAKYFTMSSGAGHKFRKIIKKYV